MNIYTDIPQLDKNSNTAVALGYFDGLHTGHRAVISAACSYAAENGLSSALFTFSLSGEAWFKGLSILQPEEKQLRAKLLGTEHYICPDFASLKGLSCEDFVSHILVKRLCAKAVFCGSDYTFGANKAGNTEILKSLCSRYGVSVTVLPIIEYNGFPVSSTRIREALKAGSLTDVNNMLELPYAISLPVVHGQGLGRKLNVPTINQIYPDNMQLPKSGVYATRVSIEGRLFAGATGLGSRPTVNGTGISCETFINGFSGDVYGQALRVEFLKFLRNTEKFSSLDELRECIENAARESESINKSL